MAHPSSSHMLSVPSDKAGMPLSPCFVHSHLDSSLSAASRSLTRREPSRSRTLHVPNGQPISPTLSPKTPRANPAARQSAPDSSPDADDGSSGSEDEEEPESITRQLAETATSVRAMSKQLARTRIKSAIQSVLIITKARDNQLIRLTRELVVWLLMSQTELQVAQPNGTHTRRTSLLPARPLVVYVDQQLRHSSRFDRASMERDHPEWFRPLASRHPFQRRFSRTNSVSSNSSLHSDRSRRSSASTDASDTFPDDGQLRYWTAEMCAKSPELFDLVITLGGDGTVLFASWLFQRVVPPIISFALGSLGFLTNFDYAHNQRVLTDAMRHGVRVNLRMRFSCTVYRAASGPARRRAVRSGKTGEIFMNLLGRSGWEALENGSELLAAGRRMARRAGTKEDKEVVCFSTHPVESFEVLNELVVDRGPSPYVSLLELFGDDHHMTTVQADGLTVSTPTGSTAYSLSAGGSLVHPEIPAMLITPICPHTLSFRPMLLPDTMELRICVPYTSRSTAWASFDGRGRVELRQGDHIKVTASAYPFPTVCADNQSTDWFQAISRTLKWNERERQKSFVVVEEPAQKPSPQPQLKRDATGAAGVVEPEEAEDEENEEEEEEEEEEEDDDEDEEVYDIDDLSSGTPIVVEGVPPRINTSFLVSEHRGERAGATPTRRSSRESSVGAENGPGPQVRSIIDHSKVVSGTADANVKTFTVWGADCCSSSSDGSGSEC